MIRPGPGIVIRFEALQYNLFPHTGIRMSRKKRNSNIAEHILVTGDCFGLYYYILSRTSSSSQPALLGPENLFFIPAGERKNLKPIHSPALYWYYYFLFFYFHATHFQSPAMRIMATICDGPTDRPQLPAIHPQSRSNADKHNCNRAVDGDWRRAWSGPVRPSIRTFVLVTMERVYLFHLMIRKQPITLMAFNFDYYYSWIDLINCTSSLFASSRYYTHAVLLRASSLSSSCWLLKPGNRLCSGIIPKSSG